METIYETNFNVKSPDFIEDGGAFYYSTTGLTSLMGQFYNINHEIGTYIIDSSISSFRWQRLTIPLSGFFDLRTSVFEIEHTLNTYDAIKIFILLKENTNYENYKMAMAVNTYIGSPNWKYNIGVPGQFEIVNSIGYDTTYDFNYKVPNPLNKAGFGFKNFSKYNSMGFDIYKNDEILAGYSAPYVSIPDMSKISAIELVACKMGMATNSVLTVSNLKISALV